jgi:preprotein translocase subunit SecE
LLACILLALALTTRLGKRFWRFAKETRGELRKVTWPTRQETIQTTLIVAALVVLVALILWGVDTFLLWIVGHLTGQG